MAILTGFAQRALRYVLLAQPGVMSLAWNLVAWLLHPIVPKRRGTGARELAP